MYRVGAPKLRKGAHQNFVDCHSCTACGIESLERFVSNLQTPATHRFREPGGDDTETNSGDTADFKETGVPSGVHASRHSTHPEPRCLGYGWFFVDALMVMVLSVIYLLLTRWHSHRCEPESVGTTAALQTHTK